MFTGSTSALRSHGVDRCPPDRRPPPAANIDHGGENNVHAAAMVARAESPTNPVHIDVEAPHELLG